MSEELRKFYTTLITDSGPVYLMTDDLVEQGFSIETAMEIIKMMREVDTTWLERK